MLEAVTLDQLRTFRTFIEAAEEGQCFGGRAQAATGPISGQPDPGESGRTAWCASVRPAWALSAPDRRRPRACCGMRGPSPITWTVSKPHAHSMHEGLE